MRHQSGRKPNATLEARLLSSPGKAIGAAGAIKQMVAGSNGDVHHRAAISHSISKKRSITQSQPSIVWR